MNSSQSAQEISLFVPGASFHCRMVRAARGGSFFSNAQRTMAKASTNSTSSRESVSSTGDEGDESELRPDFAVFFFFSDRRYSGVLMSAGFAFCFEVSMMLSPLSTLFPDTVLSRYRNFSLASWQIDSTSVKPKRRDASYISAKSSLTEKSQEGREKKSKLLSSKKKPVSLLAHDGTPKTWPIHKKKTSSSQTW